ncbi:MAG: hypothetical protein LCH56_11835 [Proteobacteria bacterium]|nr:hypothetical protein [Pseudomonadota bacterium]
MIRTRTILAMVALKVGFALLVGLVLLGPAAFAPARAQIMPSQGIDIPWFTSKAEKAQRDACRRNLPECRSSVRAQMAIEESITVIVPWAGLGIAIIGVLFWLRGQEKKRERQKKLARMHHTPGAFKQLDKDKQERRGGGGGDGDEEADRPAY